MKENFLLRNIDSDIKIKLEELAASKHMSLNSFINVILKDYVMSAEIRNINDKYSELFDKLLFLYEQDHEEMKRVISENTETLSLVLQMRSDR